MNRLNAASESGNWTQTYIFDRFGNRAVTSNSYIPPGGEATMTPQVAPSATESSVLAIFPNNKWTGATHNSGGNQTAINGVLTGIQYDAESRMVQVTNAGSASTYSYDGEGRRVQRVSGGVTTQYVYDANGELAAEYSSAPATVSGTKIPVEDHLGSIRGELNTSGTYDECYDFLPFGQTISGFGRTASCFTPSSSTTAMKFTGKQRDTETGLDYFGARYMSSAQGRFTSADSYTIVLEMLRGRDETEQKQILNKYLSNPQNWNKYAYVLNNPLRMVDPDGHNEVSAEECQKNSKCVTVAINVIVDPNANVDQAKLDKQIAAIKSFYGDANIHFEVSQISGTLSSDTIQPNAINLAVVGVTPNGAEGVSTVTKEGFAITWLSARDSDVDTGIHEFAHHFLGHTTGWFNAVASNEFAAYTGPGLFLKGLGEARVGMLELLGPTNITSKTGNFTPRKDIVSGAQVLRLEASHTEDSEVALCHIPQAESSASA